MATGDEAAVIFEPLDVLDAGLMLAEAEEWRLLHRVELIHVHADAIVEGKEVTTVRELDLLHICHVWDCVVRLQPIVKQIHHLHAILKPDDDVQPRRMQSHTHRWFFELPAHLQLKSVPTIAMGPDADCPVRSTSCKDRFLYADIQTVNLLAVERTNKVLIALLHVGSFEIYVYFDDLIGVSRKDQRFFLG